MPRRTARPSSVRSAGSHTPETLNELRTARCAFARFAADGRVSAQGEAEARLGDDALTVGDVTLAWLDADQLTAADYHISIDCWPEGRVELSQLGRRFDTFAERLRHHRDAARVAGLYAHGVAMPEIFPGALLEGPAPRPADFQLFDTHVTVVPRDADPFQVPLGALRDVTVLEDPPAIALITGQGRTVAGQLARRRDAFHRAVTEAREAQRRLLEETTGLGVFSDGSGVSRGGMAGFEALLARFCAPARLEGAHTLVSKSAGGEPRLGLVRLLDPDGDAAQPAEPLPEHWASFLLVPVGKLVVLEILAGPSAATYVFAGDIDQVNRDLQLLHFRRAPLALSEAQAALTPDNPHRLALRRLEPLKRQRSATRARIIHNDGWPAALAAALG